MENNNNNNNNNGKIETKKNHMVIMQHGLHADYRDFQTIKTQFEKQKQLDNCIFIAANSNSHFLATHDGIDKIGERLFNEVKELYEKHGHPEKISLIGHSLGGLIVRYTIGLLYKDGFFEKCKPDQFISLSSPHVGSRRPSTTVFNKVANIFCDYFLSVTGRQLILHDSNLPVDMVIEKKEENEIVTNDQEVPIPLLVRLSEGIFFDGLKSFRKRTLYSNIYNDVQVNFCTSDISPKNPYTLGKLMKFSEKYKHIIEEESVLDIDTKLIDNTINIDDCFSHDTHHLYLKRILKNLNQLQFTRFHMYFNNMLSHTNVIVKREWVNREGFEIVDHLSTHFEA